MLDREDAVVAGEPQLGDHVPPELLPVAVADGAEDPRPVLLVGVLLGVEDAVAGDVRLVEPGVLHVDMEDGVAQLADADERIHPLPEEVRRVEVDPDRLATGLPQPPERLGVISDEAGMQLDRDADVVVLRVLASIGPVGSDDLVPLPVKELGELRRPGAGDPVRLRGVRAVAGAAGEVDDVLDTELAGKADRLAERLVLPLRRLRVGVDGIAVAGQRADFEPTRRDLVHPLLLRRVIVDERIKVAMGATGMAAGADLDRLAAGLLDEVQCFLERTLREQDGKDADLHECDSFRRGKYVVVVCIIPLIPCQVPYGRNEPGRLVHLIDASSR